jgi:hypothetical protein
MVGHSRSQNGVATLAYAGHPRLHFKQRNVFKWIGDPAHDG